MNWRGTPSRRRVDSAHVAAAAVRAHQVPQVALAEDHAQYPVAGVLAEVGDVGGAGLIDAQGVVQQQPHHRRAQRLSAGVGGGDQGPGLVPVQADGGRVVRITSVNMRLTSVLAGEVGEY